MSKGSILIYTSAAGQAAPLPGVTLTVTDAGGSVRARPRGKRCNRRRPRRLPRARG